MGMSASQARFLSLTARKTNVEYEGQQINQQRTTLSNQSASYYSQLTNLTVPTPPSTQDYSRITYTFEDGTEVNTINQLVATKDEESGKVIYMVNYTQQTLQDNVVTNGTVIVNRDMDVNTNEEAKDPNANYVVKTETIDGKEHNIAYTIGSTPLRKLADASWFPTFNSDNTVTASEKGGADYYLKYLSNDQLKETLEMEKIYLDKLNRKYDNNENSQEEYYVRYQKDSETGKWTPIFYSATQVENANYNDNGNSLSSIKSYVWGQATESNDIKNARATAEQDSSGRYKSITIYATDKETGNIDWSKSTTYKLTATNTTDDDAYNDAMNKYSYDKSKYDKTIQDINSKIQIIQQQDKNLELKLKQLDTEQNAISTEMEAVKKVIQKNVESTFKTFS